MDQSFNNFIDAVLMKGKLLSEGVAIDPNIVSLKPYKSRVEHLYRHDHGQPQAVDYPQEMILFSDPVLTNSLPVIVNVRSNPESNWLLRAVSGKAVLHGPDNREMVVALQAEPPFYSKVLPGGIPAWKVAQLLGADLVGVVPHNYCHYFADGDQCKFCEIVPNYVASRTYPSVRKPIPSQINALLEAIKPPTPVRNIVLTAGNFPTNDFTMRLYSTIMDEVLGSPDAEGKYVFGSLMAPESLDLIPILRQSGFNGIAFNLEAWHPEIFARIAPGKAAFGRDRMLRALDYAVEVFGKGNVFSNLVYGVQSLDETLDGTSFDAKREDELSLEGAASLLEMGVVPLHTIYHTTGSNQIGRIPLDSDATIDFYLQYGRLVHDAGIIDRTRQGVLFEIGSISNHLYNDALLIARVQAKHGARGR